MLFSASRAYLFWKGRSQYPVKGPTWIAKAHVAKSRVMLSANDRRLESRLGVSGKEEQSGATGAGQRTLGSEGLSGDGGGCYPSSLQP